MTNRQQPLVVLEMANNHMGSVEHGLRILAAFQRAVDPFRASFEFAFKLQARHLDTFIHPEFQGRKDIKFVKRFEETRLSREDFRRLRDGIRDQDFLAICTPFDEASVDLVEELAFDHLKIASCSLGDWPLLERIARSPLPVIASTAGSDFETLDRVVSFFGHRKRPLSILHCVAEYPTPAARLNLNQIDLLRRRYPGLPIGFSTHEDPANTRFVQMALAKGAEILEKHVGVPTPEWPLNAYSSDPEQCAAWLAAAEEALQAMGSGETRYAPSREEIDSLLALRRGVFVRNGLKAGERLDPADVLLAIPTQPGQLTANDLSKYTDYYARVDLPALGAVQEDQVRKVDNRERVYGIVQEVRRLLKDSHVVAVNQAEVEISHHYGIDRFEEIGATIVNIVNRAYCKKLIALLPGQRHPEQYHKVKEETFHVLHGDLEVRLDGKAFTARTGDVITVERGVRHEFWTTTGAVVEEVSSTHRADDSFYTDPAIQQNPHRKTRLAYFFE